ncbi:hypothetical protein PR048_008833 [Dryococelus australis]|uniref:MADF domain-containing protein n=1 Tax=Dryococelus australis TaxID=614101 RepID=A0ABQ9HY87_9NEOP|nr:hypothetical protein PR048_008833 [Dryococelus australis]
MLTTTKIDDISKNSTKFVVCNISCRQQGWRVCNRGYVFHLESVKIKGLRHLWSTKVAERFRCFRHPPATLSSRQRGVVCRAEQRSLSAQASLITPRLPCLHSPLNYKHKKNNAWSEIGEEMQINKAEVQTKFRNLTSQFYRESKKVRSGSGADSKSKWFAFEYLKFMTDKTSTRYSRDSGALKVIKTQLFCKLCAEVILCSVFIQT